MSASPPTTRASRTAAVRARIYASAMRLFGERGYAETPVGAIVAEAGVAKGTFFSHFPSKAHVLLAYHDGLAPEVLRCATDAQRGEGARDRVLNYYDALGVLAEREGAPFRLLVRELLYGPLLLPADPRGQKFGTWPVLWRPALHLVYQFVERGKHRGDVSRAVSTLEVVAVLDAVWSAALADWAHRANGGPGPGVLAQPRLGLVLEGLAVEGRKGEDRV